MQEGPNTAGRGQAGQDNNRSQWLSVGESDLEIQEAGSVAAGCASEFETRLRDKFQCSWVKKVSSALIN